MLSSLLCHSAPGMKAGTGTSAGELLMYLVVREEHGFQGWNGFKRFD
jgi:hypothetical protein